MSDEDLAKAVLAALERDPRINLHRSQLRTDARGGAVVIEGEVAELAEKRLAVRLAGDVNGVRRVVDRIRVHAAEPMSDAQLGDHLRRALLSEDALVQHVLRQVEDSGRTQTLREPGDAAGEIVFRVEDGSIHLRGKVWSHSHRRLAEALAWWIPGTLDVANELEVTPQEADTDADLADAVRLILEKDHLLSSDQLTIRAENARVVLGGAIANPEQKRLAEHDAWCVAGVREVDNRIVTP